LYQLPAPKEPLRSCRPFQKNRQQHLSLSRTAASNATERKCAPRNFATVSAGNRHTLSSAGKVRRARLRTAPWRTRCLGATVRVTTFRTIRMASRIPRIYCRAGWVLDFWKPDGIKNSSTNVLDRLAAKNLRQRVLDYVADRPLPRHHAWV